MHALLLRSRPGLLAALAALVCAGVVAATSLDGIGSARADGIVYIRPAEAMRRLERSPGTIVLDVRTPEEFASGHLASAVLLPVDKLGAKASAVLKDRNRAVVIYCHSGGRSDRAAKELQAQGFTNVASVVGGIVAWKAAGYPIVK